MAADTPNVILCIRQEHGVVIRDGTVPRVRQPEVLPYHHAMAIARLVESLVADLADPVANHRKVHLTVVSHCAVIFTRPIAQHRFTEAPVAAARDEAAAVDPQLQCSALLTVRDLPDASLERLAVQHGAPLILEAQFHIV